MKTISLHSQKGGTGKTTLALMLAERLGHKSRVACIDMDLTASTLRDRLVAPKPKRYLDELFLTAAGSEKTPTLEELGVVFGTPGHLPGRNDRQVTFIFNAGLDDRELFTGSCNLLDIEKQTGIIKSQLTKLYELLEEAGYDYVIVDSGSGLVNEGLIVLESQFKRTNKATLFVTTDDRSRIFGLCRAVNDQLQVDLQHSVLVVNKCLPTLDLTRDALEAMLRSDRATPMELPQFANYARIFANDALYQPLGSPIFYPDWACIGCCHHSGTDLCTELFGEWKG